MVFFAILSFKNLRARGPGSFHIQLQVLRAVVTFILTSAFAIGIEVFNGFAAAGDLE